MSEARESTAGESARPEQDGNPLALAALPHGISVVVPVYESADDLEPLVARLETALRATANRSSCC